MLPFAMTSFGELISKARFEQDGFEFTDLFGHEALVWLSRLLTLYFSGFAMNLSRV